MTWYPSDTTPEVSTATPRRHRHRWCKHTGSSWFDRSICPVDGWMHTICDQCHRPTDGDGSCAIKAGTTCSCGAVRDAAVSRRSRANRSRGNAIERDWCHRLHLRLTGKYGDVADGMDAMFVGQCKSRATGAFPGWMADELDKLANLRTGKTPILGVVEAPGAGRKARRLVVVDEADWIQLHVGGET